MAVEFLTGVEQRRRWRVKEKLRVVAEVEQPGTCFAEAARRHEVSAGLLWNWRRQVQRGVLRPVTGLRFLPVQLTLEPTPCSVTSPMQPTGQAAFVDGMIEIALGVHDGLCRARCRRRDLGRAAWRQWRAGGWR
ncbi:MAG TPA: transposase [Acetobacteraceae bacterium]|nr:transposase [Acetobacteraceae bacterium]